MRLTSILIAALLTTEHAIGQTAPLEIFSQVSTALKELPSIQYDTYREINNFKDNYFSKNGGSCYFAFDSSKAGELSRFQLKSDKSLQVFNGTEFFSLYEPDKTFESGRKNVSDLSSLSLLYNSLPVLRISLPFIVADTRIPKSVKDTVMDGRTYLLLKFQLHKQTLQFPSGFSGFEADVTRYYELLVDPKTKLPYCIIDRNSIMKDQYFTKTIFSNIDTHPKARGDNSWFLSSYKGYAPMQDVKRIPLVKVGAQLPDWVLPQLGEANGKNLQLASLRGKKIMIEFWIKNCGYCMEAFPGMKELQAKYASAAEILSVNAYDEKKEVTFFFEREKPAYKMLYNGEKLANTLGIYAYPTLIIADEKGTIIYVQEGFNKEKIAEVLEK